MLQYYYVSSINQRLKNEDSLGFKKFPVNHCREGLWVLTVADGMGDGAEGEVYSRLAVTETMDAVGGILSDMQKQPTGKGHEFSATDVARMTMQRIPGKIGEMNRKVISAAREMGIRGGGSTVASALVIGNMLVTFNVGDSPIYLLSRGTARELSVRDNQAEELVRQGRIDRNSDQYIKNSGVLTAFLGSSRTPDPHAAMTVLSDGDAVILGTDGAFGDMTCAEDVACELRSVPPSGYADRLCAASVAATYDNQSVIAAVYSSEKHSLFDRLKQKHR